jgi:Family of unknown function (DUF6869)
MPADPKHLQELLDDFRMDELLSLVTLEEIAEAWCRYQTRPHIAGVEEEDADWWAVELLMDSDFLSDERRVRQTLTLLINQAPSEDVLGVVAAGPLENFVTDDEDRLRWIEEQAKESPRFREALRRAWLWDLPAEAFARLERAAGGELPRPAEGAVIEVVAGDLPGTVHIRRNGTVVEEIETEPEQVDGMIDRLRRHL